MKSIRPRVEKLGGGICARGWKTICAKMYVDYVGLCEILRAKIRGKNDLKYENDIVQAENERSDFFLEYCKLKYHLNLKLS